MSCRVTRRNLLGLWHFAVVRARSPHQRFGVVVFDRGVDTDVDRSAAVTIGRHVRFIHDCTVHLRGRVDDIASNVFFNRG